MAYSYIWPSSLPQRPLNNYSETTGVMVIRTQPDLGPARRPDLRAASVALQRGAQLVVAGDPAQPATGDQPLGDPGAGHRAAGGHRHAPAGPRAVVRGAAS